MTFKIDRLFPKHIPPIKSHGRKFYEELSFRLKQIQEQAEEGQQIIWMVSIGDKNYSVDSIGFVDPSFIWLKAKDSDGDECDLFSDATNIQFASIKMDAKDDEEKSTIGFH